MATISYSTLRPARFIGEVLKWTELVWKFLSAPNFPGDVNVGGDLSVEGDGAIAGDLVVTGDTTTRKLTLSSPRWDDLRFPVGAVKFGGAGLHPPTETVYKGSTVLAFDTGPNDDSIQFIAQLPHKYLEGSDIDIHVHFTIPTSGAGVGAENVKWDVTYAWANRFDQFPAETAVSKTIDLQNLSADNNFREDIVDIDGTGKEISSILLCSLTRDVSVANDYADDIYFIEVDIHYRTDTPGGSTGEMAK